MAVYDHLLYICEIPSSPHNVRGRWGFSNPPHQPLQRYQIKNELCIAAGRACMSIYHIRSPSCIENCEISQRNLRLVTRNTIHQSNHLKCHSQQNNKSSESTSTPHSNQRHSTSHGLECSNMLLICSYLVCDLQAYRRRKAIFRPRSKAWCPLL
jgi:hypothetical protein